jgi:hypothetical protein
MRSPTLFRPSGEKHSWYVLCCHQAVNFDSNTQLPQTKSGPPKRRYVQIARSCSSQSSDDVYRRTAGGKSQLTLCTRCSGLRVHVYCRKEALSRWRKVSS